MNKEADKPPVEQSFSEPPRINQPGGLDYEDIAGKIGFVPNTRKSDNVWQAKFMGVSILVGVVAGAAIGHLTTGGEYGWLGGIVLGLLASLVLGAIVSGAILAIRRMKE